MTKTEFSLRSDERSKIETELFLPCALVVSVAAIVLFSSHGAVPGQFSGRHFAIPWWGALLAVILLLAVVGLRLQRPRRYEISSEGLDVILPFVTYRIPLNTVSEVVSVSERTGRPWLEAVFFGTFQRVVEGFASVAVRLSGKPKIVQRKTVNADYTTAATGGVEVICKNGNTAVFSPAELSPFLNEIEFELKRAHSDAKVVREARVQISH